MKAHHAARLGTICFAMVTTAGCGASLQAVYEGDVRFEHCMSLDVQPQVSPDERRECWSEWVSFYTYGQTRDRVLHAQLRIKQLGGESLRLPREGEPGDGDDTRGDRAPDSVHALVPMPGSATGDALPPPGASEDPAERCIDDCQASHEQCGRGCNDATCLAVCHRGHEACVRKCS